MNHLTNVASVLVLAIAAAAAASGCALSSGDDGIDRESSVQMDAPSAVPQGGNFDKSAAMSPVQANPVQTNPVQANPVQANPTQGGEEKGMGGQMSPIKGEKGMAGEVNQNQAQSGAKPGFGKAQ